MTWAKSIPPVSSNTFSDFSVMIGMISFSMFSCVSGGRSIFLMMPRWRIMGGKPTLRCKSEPSCFMTARKSLLTSGSFLASAAMRKSSSRESMSAMVLPQNLLSGSDDSSEPNRNAVFGQVFLGRGDAVLVIMKDARGQRGIRPHAERLIQVGGLTRPAAGHYWNSDRLRDRFRHRKIIPAFCPVRIHRRENNLAGAQFLDAPGPRNRL